MLLQLLIGGTATGCLYSIIAIGFALLWQTSQVINFAQGDFIAGAAFVMLFFYAILHLPYALSLALTCFIIAFIFGFVFKTAVVQRLIERPLLSLVCATIGIGILTQNSLIFYSSEGQPFPSIIDDTIIPVANSRISSLELLNIFLGVVIIIALQLFVRKTRTGKALQAVAQNRETAKIVGIDVSRMVTLVFVINAVLVTLAAVLISPIYIAKYDMGAVLGLRAFYAAIVGGFNQIRGALLGGLLIGYIEVFTSAYITSEYSEVVILAILIATILFKPEGIWGTKEVWSKEL